MTKSDSQIARQGYQPITEGYQPGQAQPVQKGYTPITNAGEDAPQAPPQPPSGGSSAARPAQK